MKWAREKVGLSQAQLAEAATGKGRKQTVSGWENDGAVPEVEYLQRIADALGVTVAWLLGDTDDGQATLQPRTPSLVDMEWLPRLIEKVIDKDGLTGAERQGLIAEINAAGMRYWALAAEWSAGQRGIAMTRDAEASGERAKANGEEAKSATARALSIHRKTRAEAAALEEATAEVEAIEEAEGEVVVPTPEEKVARG